jgi:hypothetical protein
LKNVRLQLWKSRCREKLHVGRGLLLTGCLRKVLAVRRPDRVASLGGTFGAGPLARFPAQDRLHVHSGVAQTPSDRKRSIIVEAIEAKRIHPCSPLGDAVYKRTGGRQSTRYNKLNTRWTRVTWSWTFGSPSSFLSTPPRLLETTLESITKLSAAVPL